MLCKRLEFFFPMCYNALEMGYTRRKQFEIWWGAMMIFCIVLIILLAVLAISYFCYRTAFFVPRKNRDVIPEAHGKQFEPHRDTMRRIFSQLTARKYEDVTVRSHDGLLLAAKYYHLRDGAPLVIAFHGYRSCGLTDFAGGSELCFEMGYNLLLIDERAHGKSEGRTITFGIEERYDCLTWVKYAIDRFGNDVKIVLFGISMGAATVLMASGLPLPENVKAIAADCPYSSPADIIRKVCKDRHYPPRLSYPFVVLGARLFGHFHLNATTAARSVKNTRVPILIIHGEKDNFVPAEMSAQIKDANPARIRRETFPDADHGISFLMDEARYKTLVRNFLTEALR